MSDTLVQALLSLRDVDGVTGSFVFHRDGSMRARDLPDYFDDQVLAEIGPRIERLYEAWQTCDTSLETTTLVFAEHKLHLRALDSGFLAVVSTVSVNAAALKMALVMVSRKVAAELTAAPPPTPPSAASTAAEPPPKPRFFRGARLW